MAEVEGESGYRDLDHCVGIEVDFWGWHEPVRPARKCVSPETAVRIMMLPMVARYMEAEESF